MLVSAMDMLKALESTLGAVSQGIGNNPGAGSIARPASAPHQEGKAYVATLENQVETLKERVESLEAQLTESLDLLSITHDRGSGAPGTSPPGNRVNPLSRRGGQAFTKSMKTVLADEGNGGEFDSFMEGRVAVDTAFRGSRRRTISGDRALSGEDDAGAWGGLGATYVDEPGERSGTKTPFQMIVCTDEVCEILEPADQSITTQHQDSTVVKFKWKDHQRPKSVLVVKKRDDEAAEKLLVECSVWLMQQFAMKVYVEPSVHAALPPGDVKVALETFGQAEVDEGTLHNRIDFVISLGGDGTILWIGKLFHGPVPPVISFAMGSLGFLTPFAPSEYKATLGKFIKSGAFISMRSRLAVRVERRSSKADGGQATSYVDVKHKKPEHYALNEVVIDRGPSSVLSNLVCYYNDKLLTRVQADGLIIGTPTGSTAYSLSAGGAIVHPAVPSLLVTPICPHTLSFRPVVLPDSATLRVQVPPQSRATAWAAFDGRDRCELNFGDSLVVWVSPHPVPAVTKLGERGDWTASLRDGLNWNVRREQKPFSGSKQQKE
jgi:NAD+ kinase